MQDSSILSFFQGLGIWGWFVFGGILMTLEIFVPGTFFLWFGIAALLTGALAYALGLAWQAQFGVFAILAAASFIIWWRMRDRMRPDAGEETLNRRAERHIGRRFVLAEPVSSGVGRVRIDDTFWRIEGPDTPAGAEVRVVAVDGGTLRIEAAQ